MLHRYLPQLCLACSLSLMGAALPADQPQGMVDLASVDAQHLLVGYSDGWLHKLKVLETTAQTIERLKLPGRGKQLVLSPDHKLFAGIAIRQPADFEIPPESRLVVGTVNPLRILAEMHVYSSFSMDVQSLMWVAGSTGQPQQNGVIVVGTGHHRLGFKWSGKRLEKTFQIDSPVRNMDCYSHSVEFQNQGWTAWSPSCRQSQMPPVEQKHLLIERWALNTGKSLGQITLNPHAVTPTKGHSTVKMAATSAGLFVGLGHSYLDSLLYSQSAAGKWQAQIIPKTSLGLLSAMTASDQQLYVAFQWLGKIIPLSLKTRQWGGDLQRAEGPMAMAIQDNYLYVGLQFGGLDRYPLKGGKPVRLNVGTVR